MGKGQSDINIFIDISASMDYGNPNKWDIAKLLALELGYAALKQMNKLTIYGFNQDLQILCQSVQGMESIHTVELKLDSIDIYGKTDFNAIAQVRDYKKGITFVISDLFGKNLENILDSLSGDDQEVVIIQVLAQEEIIPDFLDEFKSIEMESGYDRLIDMNDRVKKIYTEKIENFIDEQKKICSIKNIRYVLITNDISPTKIMEKVLVGV